MTAREKLEMHLNDAQDGLAGLDCLVLPYYGKKLHQIVKSLALAVDFVARGKTDPNEVAEPLETIPRSFCQVCDRIAFSASADPRVCADCLSSAMADHEPTATVADDPIAVFLLEWFLRHYSEREVSAELLERCRRISPLPSGFSS